MRLKFNESCIYLRNIHTTYKFTTTKRCSPHKRTRITKHRKHLNQPKRLLTTIPSRRDVCAMCRCRCCCCRCCRCCCRLLSPLLPPPPHINISLCLHFIHSRSHGHGKHNAWNIASSSVNDRLPFIHARIIVF